MRSISTEFKDYLATDTPTIANLWILTLKDGLIKYLTDYSDDIIYQGNTYESISGQERSAIQFNSNLTDDNFETGGFIIDSTHESELRSGRYDNAVIEKYVINPFDHSMGSVKLVDGNLGRVKLVDGKYKAEVHSKISKLNAKTGWSCSPTCRAELGDSKCGVNLTSYTTTGTVDGINPAELKLAVTLGNTSLDFYGGKLTWTSGNNNGTTLETKGWAAGDLSLFVFPVREIQLGDTFDLVQGCDKTFYTCGFGYSNRDNFRGEPNIPGSDAYFARVQRREGSVS